MYTTCTLLRLHRFWRQRERRRNSLRPTSFTISDSLELHVHSDSPSFAIHSSRLSSPNISVDSIEETLVKPKQNFVETHAVRQLQLFYFCFKSHQHLLTLYLDHHGNSTFFHMRRLIPILNQELSMLIRGKLIL